MINPKKKSQLTAVIAALLSLMLTFTTCGGGGGGEEEEEDSEFYVWFYSTEGGGDPPESKWVKSGEIITLPGQGDMIAPTGRYFRGWIDVTDGYPSTIYAAGETITVWSNRSFRAEWRTKKYSQGGIYISLMSFAGDAEFLRYTGWYDGWQDSEDDFILLNSYGGKPILNNRLEYSYNRADASGTALFYAVHKALANLTANAEEFLTDISSVNIITFTDGLDNASFGASDRAPIEGKSEVTSVDYAAYLSSEIGSRTINGMPITAHSVGIRGSDVGSDVESEEQFTANLTNIASAPGNVKQLTDFSELENVFSEIAESLRFDTHFSMTTTQNNPGTIVRMTFDVIGTTSAEAAESVKYIDGTLAFSNGVWTLTNIAYGGGITSDTASGGSIIGTVPSSGNVSFLFKNISGHNDAAAPIQQWTKASAGSTTWQRNSEYSASGSVSASTAIIQLVLDASTSLDYGQVGQIRSAVSSFIETLSARIQN